MPVIHKKIPYRFHLIGSRSYVRPLLDLDRLLEQLAFYTHASLALSFRPNSKLAADNADLRLDRERLLGVVRRYKDTGRKESVAAHRDRLRKRHMSEKEVCYLCSRLLHCWEKGLGSDAGAPSLLAICVFEHLKRGASVLMPLLMHYC